MINFLSESYGLSKRDSSRVLSLVNSIGACTYASTATAIEYEYRDKPERFEACFGFPLYKDAKVDGYYYLNSEQLLLDMFVYANSSSIEAGKQFSILVTDDGKATYSEDRLFIVDETTGTITINDEFVNDYLYQDLILQDGELKNIESEVSSGKTHSQVYYSLSHKDPDQYGYNIELLNDYIKSNDEDVSISFERLCHNYTTSDEKMSKDDIIMMMEDVKKRVNDGQSVIICMGGDPDNRTGFHFLREGGSLASFGFQDRWSCNVCNRS